VRDTAARRGAPSGRGVPCGRLDPPEGSGGLRDPGPGRRRDLSREDCPSNSLAFQPRGPQNLERSCDQHRPLGEPSVSWTCSPGKLGQGVCAPRRSIGRGSPIPPPWPGNEHSAAAHTQTSRHHRRVPWRLLAQSQLRDASRAGWATFSQRGRVRRALPTSQGDGHLGGVRPAWRAQLHHVSPGTGRGPRSSFGSYSDAGGADRNRAVTRQPRAQRAPHDRTRR
jgi:hypothetical protein